MNREELQNVMTYTAHSSAVNDKYFIRKYLVEQQREYYVTVFTLAEIQCM